MISNYVLACDYNELELKDIVYLIPDYALKVIYTDGFNEAMFSGNTTNMSILEGYDISFKEDTSFDERFTFSKEVSISVDGRVTFNELYHRYMVILETKKGEFYLVNADFPSFVTHTYTLQGDVSSTELVFSSQSNIPTLKLTNFNPNKVNLCKAYSNSKVKNVKLTETWASYLSTWQKTLVNKGEFVDVEPLKDSISVQEEFDGEKYTVTLSFNIPMSYYKNDWHTKLLEFTENEYRGYISLEDGNVIFVGYNTGLFPSYSINGDIITIRLQEVSNRGLVYGNEYAVIDTDMPNSIEFEGASCYTYNFSSTCDWNIENKPEYITISPMAGNANTEYALQICNTDTETSYEVSEFVIKTCNARVRPQVIVENPMYRWVNTEETVCVIEPIERTVSGDPYCNNYDKYIDVVNEISYDDGETWQFVSSASTLVEADSPDCGYIPPIEVKYILTLQDSSIVSGECDSSSRITNGELSAYKSTCTEIEVGECVTSISDWALSGFTQLANIIIPDNVTTIGIRTFDSCSGLTEIELPNSINLIAQGAFFKCSGLREITIPSGVTEIRNSVFQFCSSLSSITMHSGVTSIGENAFSGCSSLQTVDIPTGMTSIPNGLFGDCSSLTGITIPTGVTSIGEYAFRECSSLTGISLPNNVSTIGMYAFHGCSNFTDFTIPSGVSTINKCTFMNCTGLKQINIPNNVSTIGKDAFWGCTSLSSVTLSDNVSSIGEYAFCYCSDLTELTIPSGVTSIGQYAFGWCSGLTSVTVEATTPPTLGSGAFYDSICPIYVPCESVDAYKAASGWSDYASRIEGIPPCVHPKVTLTLNDSSVVIVECDSTSAITSGDVSSRYSGTVVSAVVGDCVKTIQRAAFKRCTSLTSCELGDGLTKIGDEAFSGCTNLANINIPSGVTSIGYNAFNECSNLSSVVISNSVTFIDDGAFERCYSLSSVTIGSGVTRIDSYAFRHCSGLTSVTVEATTPPNLGSYVFYNASNCPIYVPSGSVNAYKSASGWSTYSSRIQAIT